MAISTQTFTRTPIKLISKSPNFALQILVFFRSKHTVPVIIDADVQLIFLYKTWYEK